MFQRQDDIIIVDDPTDGQILSLLTSLMAARITGSIALPQADISQDIPDGLDPLAVLELQTARDESAGRIAAAVVADDIVAAALLAGIDDEPVVWDLDQARIVLGAVNRLRLGLAHMAGGDTQPGQGQGGLGLLGLDEDVPMQYPDMLGGLLSGLVNGLAGAVFALA